MKQWIIRNKYIVTERRHETEISDFAVDTISGRVLGVLFPFRSAHERLIYAELESGIINIDQPCMEWLSGSEKALYHKLEVQKSSINSTDKLLALFTDVDAAADFMERYFSMYETPNLKADEVDLFGWDAVADEISNLVWQRPYEIGDFVEIEISRLNTKTGNPELITVGELVEKPTEDNEFSGDYKFTN